MSTINAGSTTPTALTLTGDTTGALDLSTGGTTRLTVTSGGNLNFAGTGQRITGDFSNATPASRLMFQTSTTNGNTFLYAIPNGTSQIAAVTAANASDPNNSSWVDISPNATEGRIRSGIAGTGSYLPMTFYTGGSERVRIDTSGNVGIGGTADAASRFEILGTASVSSGSCRGVRVSYTIPSTATATSAMFASAASTQAASFTLANALHFVANGVTVGSGSSITNQYGFVAQDSMTGATNNYGFYSNIASGSNRWNFYAAGTAQNYFAGDTAVGRAPSSSVRLFVQGANTSTDYALVCYNSSEQNLFYARNNGEITTGTAANSPYNLTTGSAANVFVDSSGILYRSTSSLRYKSDVTNAVHGLADVLKLRSVTYTAKNSGDTVFGGLIAEEVHDAGLTEFVAYDKEGQPDAIHYGNMVALLTKAIQEQQAMIDELKAKVAALEAK